MYSTALLMLCHDITFHHLPQPEEQQVLLSGKKELVTEAL
jgi:hypothetical protein